MERLKSEIRRYINNLEKRNQIILALYFIEKLSIKEIAKVIGLNEKEIKKIIIDCLDFVKERDKKILRIT